MSAHTTGANAAASRLRALLGRENEILLVPGVFDAMSARAALSVGSHAICITAAGACSSRLGQPSSAPVGTNEMSQHTELIASLNPEVPLIADSGPSFNGPAMIARLIEKYDRIGVAAVHIGDLMEEAGEQGGKEVISRATFLRVVKAAYDARTKLGSDMVIIAKTDAIEPHDYEEARERLRLALSAGADAAVLEGIASAEQGRAICSDLAPSLVLLNMAEHGAGLSCTVAEAREMGFRAVVLPFASVFSASYDALCKAYERLKKTG